jgi:hypothetical protein
MFYSYFQAVLVFARGLSLREMTEQIPLKEVGLKERFQVCLGDFDENYMGLASPVL